MNNNNISIDEIISNSQSSFASTIAEYKWQLIPRSQMEAARLALSRSDYISRIACANPEAVYDALTKAAVLGLDLTDGKRQGWLLPRKSQKKDAKGKYITVIVLQVGYKGVEAIHQRMGVIDSLSVRVVRKNDTFSWSGDDREKPTHSADWFGSEESRGDIVGAFSITYYPNNSIGVATAPLGEIYGKHRDISDSWKKYQEKLKKNEYAFPPPWVTHDKAMIEKTMAYISSKQWPAHTSRQEISSRIFETLHATDTEDYSTLQGNGKNDQNAKPSTPKALPGYHADKFSQSVAAWGELINSGKKTPAQIIATISNKYTLNKDQIKTINDITEPAVVDAEWMEDCKQGELAND